MDTILVFVEKMFWCVYRVSRVSRINFNESKSKRAKRKGEKQARLLSSCERVEFCVAII